MDSEKVVAVRVERVGSEHNMAIEPYEHLLMCYAKTNLGGSRSCLGMDAIEQALLELIDKGMDKKYAKHVTVAMAIVVHDAMMGGFVACMSGTIAAYQAQRSYYRKLRDDLKFRNDAINNAAKWLASLPKQQGLRRYTLIGAKRILNRIDQEYYPDQCAKKKRWWIREGKRWEIALECGKCEVAEEVIEEYYGQWGFELDARSHVTFAKEADYMQSMVDWQICDKLEKICKIIVKYANDCAQVSANQEINCDGLPVDYIIANEAVCTIGYRKHRITVESSSEVKIYLDDSQIFGVRNGGHFIYKSEKSPVVYKLLYILANIATLPQETPEK